ncbi:MarR family transcriptional regulator [Pontibacter sp. BT310]|uniref:MarR family transcriptional regulator n=1 Tax=Pontibacter populi TaxID=890055 RepID=A0ABS6XI16_9BACT|nr:MULTISPECIES: MarR family transcriptional regulator [Pontibacter]MBJ6120007.1 MarR family transcriptional regulator [Pontibacter sp. BT310]MBR0572436.1 MarR family transcriptional regulator [Microvirga sp. STS03]MBW3366860.1 MarR family transcriptional regulator [Pontibacter populi]
MHFENEVGIKIRNEWQKASLNLLYTSGFLFNGYESFFKRHGLTTQQYNALRILRDQYPTPISTSGLRDKMLDKMSDTSRLVSRLNAKGFVDVKQNPHDKRLVNIILSEKGHDLMAGIDPELSLLDGLLSDLSEEEATQLSELLSKVRKSIKTASKRIRVTPV